MVGLDLMSRCVLLMMDPYAIFDDVFHIRVCR